MSDPTYDPLRDPRTLVKSYHYIDLPGEPPDSKLWPGVNNIIKLRKHRDLVFDIKLKAGASYTLKTDQPESKYGRFYDTKRKLTVARTTFNDGEPMHIWVGRKFQGNLILVSEAKEIGRFPIRKMDCTGTCTNDPKDKPAPMIFVLHANKEVANITDAELARNLITLEGVLAKQPPSRALADALNRARRVPALASPHSELPFAVHSPELDPDDGATPTLHAFKVKQTSGPSVPDEVLSFFKSTARVFKFDEKNLNTLSCNFILGQFLGGLGTLADSFGKSAPLRGFWRRAFIIQRTANGEFILMFSTSTKERRLLGYLLGVYQTASHDIKIMTLVGGAGKFSATFKAMEGAALGSVSIASKLGKSMYIGLALDTLAWMKDYLYPDRPGDGKDLYDLLGTLFVDASAMALGSAITAALMSTGFTMGAVLLAAATGTVGGISIGAIAVTVIVGTVLMAGANYIRLSDIVANGLREAGESLDKALPKDYSDAYSTSIWNFPF